MNIIWPVSLKKVTELIESVKFWCNNTFSTKHSHPYAPSSHASNTTIHITADERTKWNTYASSDPATQVQENLDEHISNTSVHVTSTEKSTWNDKADTDHTHTTSQVTDLAAKLSTKADTDHTHTAYASVSHTHSDYAPVSHTHNDYAPVSHEHSGYASSDHNHNDAYAPISHVNDTTKHITSSERTTWNNKADVTSSQMTSTKTALGSRSSSNANNLANAASATYTEIGDIIIQCGNFDTHNSTGDERFTSNHCFDITFPKAFPTKCFVVVATTAQFNSLRTSGNGPQVIATIQGWDRTKFRVMADYTDDNNTQASGMSWIAIGN